MIWKRPFTGGVRTSVERPGGEAWPTAALAGSELEVPTLNGRPPEPNGCREADAQRIDTPAQIGLNQSGEGNTFRFQHPGGYLPVKFAT